MTRSTIEKTLVARGHRYGDFESQTRIVQSLKRIVQAAQNWPTMRDDQREAIEIILLKVGRIVNGDPNWKDSWHDISGYAKLVEDRLI